MRLIWFKKDLRDIYIYIYTMSDIASNITIQTSEASGSSDASNSVVIEPIVSSDDEILLQKQRIVQLRKARNEQMKTELVQVVCRQTELTIDAARELLEKEQYNYMKVLNDYFEIKETKKEISTSVNQQIYGEIRNLMDTGAKSFRMEQERAQYIEKMNKQRVEALKLANNKKIAKESETSETSETE
jgi:hypothetical protein